MLRQLQSLRRRLGLLALAITTFASTGLPIADAYAERASATAQSHVEEPGTRACPQVHNDGTCQLCRVLRLGGRRVDAVALFTANETSTSQPVVATQHNPNRPLAPSASPRAPPLA